MLGIPYLTVCIIAEMESRISDEAYRYYHTDCLMGICTALGAKVTRRFYDIMHPKPEDDRDPMEIATSWLDSHGFKAVV